MPEKTLVIRERHEGRSERPPPLEAGTVLGSYRLSAVIGEGATGRVYVAEHTKLGRKVALKLLRDRNADPKAVARFFGEARAVNEIRHRNIIEITDFVEGEPTYFIMELLEGRWRSSCASAGSSPAPSPRPTTRASFTAISSRPTSSSSRGRPSLTS